MTRPHRSVLLAAVATALAAAGPADACSVCASGAPTLAVGEAASAESRLSVGLEAEALQVEAGGGPSAEPLERMTQVGLRLQALARPHASLSVLASLPFVRKVASSSGVTVSDATGVGDLELSARYTLLEAGAAAGGRRILAVSAGSSLPTGAVDLAVDGVRLEEHAQPGTGAFGPFATFQGEVAMGAWRGSMSAGARLRTENRYGYRYGAAALWSAHAELRPLPSLAFVLGLDGRHAGRDRDASRPVVDTGGTVVSLAPAVSWNAAGRAWLTLRAQLPIWTRLDGEQRVGPTVVAAVQVSVY